MVFKIGGKIKDSLPTLAEKWVVRSDTLHEEEIRSLKTRSGSRVCVCRSNLSY